MHQNFKVSKTHFLGYAYAFVRQSIASRMPVNPELSAKDLKTRSTRQTATLQKQGEDLTQTTDSDACA